MGAKRNQNKPFVWTPPLAGRIATNRDERGCDGDPVRSEFPRLGFATRQWPQWPPAQRSLGFKEVIQPQVPLRLPCYDLVPVMNHTVVTVLPKVRLATSGATHSHDLTGGVYKARERIHRDIADSRLLAIPTSRSRVADSYPDYDRFFEIRSPSRDCSPLYRPL